MTVYEVMPALSCTTLLSKSCAILGKAVDIAVVSSISISNVPPTMSDMMRDSFFILLFFNPERDTFATKVNLSKKRKVI